MTFDTTETWREKLHFYEVVDSTNIQAKEFLSQAMSLSPLHHQDGSLTEQGEKIHGTVFVAEKQTAGRGRMGRDFYSPQGTGLYMSLIVVPPGGITNPASLTIPTAVAVCKAIQQVYKIRAKIKWVNDIFYLEKKIGGILVEAVMNPTLSTIPAAILGIGLNIAPSAQGFPAELKKIAGTILASPTEQTNKDQLISTIYGHLLPLPQLMPQSVIEEYRKLSIIQPGHKVQVIPCTSQQHISYQATVLAITNQAQLLVEDEQGIQKTLDSGEVSLRSQNFVKKT